MSPFRSLINPYEFLAGPAPEAAAADPRCDGQEAPAGAGPPQWRRERPADVIRLVRDDIRGARPPGRVGEHGGCAAVAGGGAQGGLVFWF